MSEPQYPTSNTLRGAVSSFAITADWLERNGRFADAELTRLERDSLLQLADDLDRGLVRYEPTDKPKVSP